MTVNLTWTPGSGTSGQSVQYRVKNSNSTWTTYATVSNSVSTQQVTLPDGAYEFRIANGCLTCLCSNGSNPVNGGCPETITVSPTQNQTITQVTPTPYQDFGTSGTIVHDDLSPTGTYTQLNTSNTFWRLTGLPNGWFDLTFQQKHQALLNLGPVNRLVVWGKYVNPAGAILNNYSVVISTGVSSNDLILTVPSTALLFVGMTAVKGSAPEDGVGTFDGITKITEIINSTQVRVDKTPLAALSNAEVVFSMSNLPPINIWIGFDVCINTQTTKTYHVAIAADNRYRMSLDGVLILSDVRESTEVFGYLHIYSVVIPAGSHILRLEGMNTGSRGGFGCEIFDLSNRGSLSVVDFLNQQSDYSNLNVVFTTRQATQFTSDLYTCAQGFTLVNPTCSQPLCSGPGPGTVPCTPTEVYPNAFAEKCLPPTVTDATITITQQGLD